MHEHCDRDENGRFTLVWTALPALEVQLQRFW